MPRARRRARRTLPRPAVRIERLVGLRDLFRLNVPVPVQPFAAAAQPGPLEPLEDDLVGVPVVAGSAGVVVLVFLLGSELVRLPSPRKWIVNA